MRFSGRTRSGPASSSSRSTAPAAAPRRAATGSCSAWPTSSTAAAASSRSPSSVSRCTAEIVAGAIYGTVLARIEAGSIERGEEFLPELVYMAVMPYLGARAAEDELLVQSLR